MSYKRSLRMKPSTIPTRSISMACRMRSPMRTSELFGVSKEVWGQETTEMNKSLMTPRFMIFKVNRTVESIKVMSNLFNSLISLGKTLKSTQGQTPKIFKVLHLRRFMLSREGSRDRNFFQMRKPRTLITIESLKVFTILRRDTFTEMITLKNLLLTRLEKVKDSKRRQTRNTMTLQLPEIIPKQRLYTRSKMSCRNTIKCLRSIESIINAMIGKCQQRCLRNSIQR